MGKVTFLFGILGWLKCIWNKSAYYSLMHIGCH